MAYELDEPAEHEVKTLYGIYIGGKTDGVLSFKGIRYAIAPRWKEPQLTKQSDEVFNATEFGPSAIQTIRYGKGTIAEYFPHYQSEDCLNLNIWTRGRTEKKRPVMLFIHGGSFNGGSSGTEWYNGHNFVKKENIVFISLNYRLNVFGFLDLEPIGGSEYRNSKYLGILDQIKALEWIKKNIILFGGDPNNITIFGESAGGASVTLLMTIPKANGLFKRAISQSGALNFIKTPLQGRQITESFLKIAETSSIKDLLEFSDNELRLLNIKLNDEYGYGSELLFSPVADNILIPANPYKAIAKGCAKNIDLIIGGNKDEVKLYRLLYPDIDENIVKFSKQNRNITKNNGEDIDELAKKYLELNPEKLKTEQLLSFATDLIFLIPAFKMAEMQSKHSRVWFYLFGWPSSIKGLGACHLLDLYFVFNNLGDDRLTGESPPQTIADSMMDSWISFAKTGDPNNKSIPSWDKYNTNNQATMMINKEWHVEKNPKQKERRLLDIYH